MGNVTTGTLKFADGTGTLVASGKTIRILGIFWTADAVGTKDIAADDDFLLSTAGGLKIIGKRASFIGDDLGVTIPPPGLSVNGLVVTTLDGGVCYVWLAP